MFGGDDDHGRGDRPRGDDNVRWERSSERQFRGDPAHYRESGSRGQQGGGEWRGQQGGGFDRGGDRSRPVSGGSGGVGGGHSEGYQGSGGGGAADTWGGSGFGGQDDVGRRFDRIDPGHVGAQGAHPMSSPVDGGYGGYGVSAGGGFGSSARSAAIIRNAQQQQHGGEQQGQQFAGQHHHDRHYTEWRQRQIHELDRDYDEYRREHQSKFEQEFGGWRQQRQTQRQHMGRVTEHMEVLGSDGQHVGTVDKVRDGKIILTKNDENAGGVHHSIPCSWIDNVEDKVTINKTAQEAMNAWTNEDQNNQNRALFERPDQGSDGPHVLNRSFSGTYDEGKS
jgi:hypothetical protein